MRKFAAVIATFVAGAAPAGANEPDQARPGGVYLQTTAPSPQACARACENDSLCMAWTYAPQTNQACELKAVIPPARFAKGSVSGLSSRAPRLLRLIPPAQAPAAPADIATIDHEEALRSAATIVDDNAADEEAGAAPNAESAADVTDETPIQTEAPSHAEAPIETEAPIKTEAQIQTEAYVTADDLTEVAAEAPHPQLTSVRLGERETAPDVAPTQSAPAAAQPATPHPAKRPPPLRSGR